MNPLKRTLSASFVVVLTGFVMTACDKDGKKEETPACEGHELGDEWPAEDGCNTCTCQAGGVSCTTLECSTTCEGGQEPGDSWPAEDGCNTCSCMEDLTVACTAMACVDTCEGGHLPGETWDAPDGCNSCECTEDLVISCTTLACPEACEDGHLVGDTWDAADGCNTCTCTEDLVIACTQMACVDTCEDGHLVGDTWDAEDGCNTCTCTEDLTIACTEMACPSTCEDGHLPGESWDAGDGCNVCACTEDLQIACTAMICPETCDGGYLPGESFPAGDGCNVCTCTAELTIACTKMLCPATCQTVEADYEKVISDNISCKSDADCQMLYGQCWIGLGGCYEFANQDLSQAVLDGLAKKFQELGCSGPVCKCAPPPAPACVDGQCGPAPEGTGPWTRVEGKFSKEGGFFYQFTSYLLANDVVTVYSAPDKVKCEVPVTNTDTAPLLPAAAAVDWPSVLPTYKNPENPFCCCDQFVYDLDVVLTAKDGTVTKVSTSWCDESMFGGTMPKPLTSFIETFVGVCALAATQCN